jgi:HlyD family secretion protein
MDKRSIVGWSLAGIAGAALVAWALAPSPVQVELGVVASGPFEETVDELARTRIRDHYTLTAPLSGQVDRIALREGDEVTARMPLAVLHPALPALLDSRTEQELRQRLEVARAGLEAAEARVARSAVAVTQARRELERSRKLAENQLVAAAKLEGDELALAMAGQEQQAAQAEAHVARHDIDLASAALSRARGADPARAGAWSLVAPIAGRVLRVQQKSAGAVVVGTPLLELGDPANLEVLIELLTTEAPRVAVGAPVLLEDWGGPAPLAGRVRRVEPLGFTKVSALGVEEQRVNVLVDLVSPRSEWQSLGEGYRLSARITSYRAASALAIPGGALFRAGERWYVYRVGPDRRAHQVPVVPAHRNGHSAEILDGLAAGDRVIVYPGDTLREGVRVVARP